MKKLLVLLLAICGVVLAGCESQQEPVPFEPVREPSQGCPFVENPDGSVTASTAGGEQITMGGVIPSYQCAPLNIDISFPKEWQDKLWISDFHGGYVIVGKLAPGGSNTVDPFACADGEILLIVKRNIDENWEEYLENNQDVFGILETASGTLALIPYPEDSQCQKSDSQEEQEIYAIMLGQATEALAGVKIIEASPNASHDPPMLLRTSLDSAAQPEEVGA